MSEDAMAGVFRPEPVIRLSRDMRAAAVALGDEEARFLVSSYYNLQGHRIASGNQVKAIERGGGDVPHSVLLWLAAQNQTLEDQVKGALDVYTRGHAVGAWLRGQVGVGPVLAAGLLAHLDIKEHGATVWKWYRFAGLDPTSRWEKGQKRPWNAELKRVCWLLGESLCKVSGREGAFYGKLYRLRKAYETRLNESGAYREQAEARLRTRAPGGDTVARKALEAGRLPLGQIHERSKRYAVKMLLSGLHMVWHWEEHGRLPHLPFAVGRDRGTGGGHMTAIAAHGIDGALAQACAAAGYISGDAALEHVMAYWKVGPEALVVPERPEDG